MTTEAVIPIRRSSKNPPDRVSLVEQVQRLAWQDTRNVRMTTRPLFQASMVEHDVDTASFLAVLRNGRCDDDPWQDQYGNWRLTMNRWVSDRRIYVEVAVRDDHLVCTDTSIRREEGQ